MAVDKVLISGCRGEGNQSNQKRILDQVLTFFVFVPASGWIFGTMANG
jgi:hypothetical protein